MKPATSTKLALFCCSFYITAGAVMQVFFYKTVTFWGCVDEVTEFRCCFWLFCTMKMVRRASAASPQGDQLAGRGRAAPHAPYGARRPPQGGARRFCGGGAARVAAACRESKSRPPANEGVCKKSFVVQDHAGAFVDVAAAEGEDKVAGFGIFAHVIRHGPEGRQTDTAGDLFAQIL